MVAVSTRYPDHPVPLWVNKLPLAKDVRATLVKHVQGRAITEKDSRTRITTQCGTKWDLDKFLKLMLLVWKKMDKIYVVELKSLCVSPRHRPRLVNEASATSATATRQRAYPSTFSGSQPCCVLRLRRQVCGLLQGGAGTADANDAEGKQPVRPSD